VKVNLARVVRSTNPSVDVSSLLTIPTRLAPEDLRITLKV
jgi:hypothetical protein